MRLKIRLEFYVLAAAAALGLALPAFAQDADATMNTAAAATHSWGLLGTAYTGAAFTYEHIESTSPSEWRGFTVDVNQPLRAGLDFNLAYDWAQADNYLLRLTQHNLNAGVTAYSAFNWGKPYVQALAGWEWREGNGPSDNSFAYTVGSGVEFQVAQPLVLTPFVNFVRATAFNQSEIDTGVKTAYRLNREWSVTAEAQYAAVRRARDGAGYSLGLDYHY
jgi:hypothetical protein